VRQGAPVWLTAGAAALLVTAVPGLVIAAAAPVAAHVTITHAGPGRPSAVEVRLDPPAAARGGELLLSIYNGKGVVNRHVLRPGADGVYRAAYPFPTRGVWRYYMRFGAGQAGFTSAGVASISPDAGSVDTFTAAFRSGSAGVPAAVQPLGYAAFGLIAAGALAGVSAILARLRRARCEARSGRSGAARS